MIINRFFCMPNKWTFLMHPVRYILDKYVKDGKGWIDPFAGMYSPAEFRNDFNKNMNAEYHLLANEFCKKMEGPFKGILFDPPYSYRQIKECYEKEGLKVNNLDTSNNFYNRVMDIIYNKINEYVISFGWNTNGFGKCRGFKIIEIVIIAHGGGHNDTIITVEKKIQKTLF